MDCRQIYTFLFIPFLFISGQAQPSSPVWHGSTSVIPLPAVMDFASGQVELNAQLTLYADKRLFTSFDPVIVFTDIFEEKIKYKIPVRDLTAQHQRDNSKIEISLDTTLTQEGYELDIYDTGIFIRASASAGVFYALQTLRQILNLDNLSNPNHTKGSWDLISMEIRDEPRFPYRGMHLDVARHFMPLDFVKKYIDLISYYKMNTFHWHLTDDQGWRIEIKKYPKLQTIAAWRDETLLGHYSDVPVTYDGQKHGGYYTHEQIKEVVAYAAQRGVTIIPEIEMPGHAQAALAAYPELGCTPGPFKVAKTWGVFEDVFCPNEITFTFLQDVLDEVMDLFPSKYIHIGGDECPKARWNESAFCQDLMKREGLKNAEELQSYFIQRMEKYVNSKGRRIIGWDEILEGGLAPDATVMSWRGTAGGIAAAKLDHDVIMTPGPPCYFDHYQSDPAFEPLAIGGYTPIEKVYEFDPVPQGLLPKEQTHILGGQGNVWTEYMTTPSHVQYMAFPRAIALAEALWTPTEKKDWKNFSSRLINHFDRLDRMDINYATHVIMPQADVESQPEGLSIIWKSTMAPPYQFIYMSQNPQDEVWQLVNSGDTFMLTTPANIYYKSETFAKTSQHTSSSEERSESLQPKVSPVKMISYNPSKSRTSKISVSPQPSERYPGRGGIKALTDGLIGNKFFNGQDWCAWDGDRVVIDLKFDELTSIDSFTLGILSSSQAWIYPPESVEVKGSTDLENYIDLGTFDLSGMPAGRNDAKFQLPGTKVKALRFSILPVQEIPSGMPGAGHEAWTFIDEISIY